MTRRPLLLVLLLLFLLPLGPAGVAFSATDHSAIGKVPPAAPLQMARAHRLQARRELDAAVAGYRTALRRDPGDQDALRGLGRTLLDQGEVAAALPYLREVAGRSRIGTDEARLGWALLRTGAWGEAADAFAAARRHGRNTEENARGELLARAAARTADGSPAGSREVPGELISPGSVTSPEESGWHRVWSTLFNATGYITATIQHLLLLAIALLIAGAILLRVWSTLMGREAPTVELGIWYRRLRRLPVRAIDRGRALGRVHRPIYDPRLARVVGFQTGGRWRRQIVPWTAVRGVGPGGVLVPDAGALVPLREAGELGALALAGALPLGRGRRLQRVVTEDGALLAYTRSDRLRVDGATGQVTFEVTPNRFHDALRVTLAVLQLGPIDWLFGKLLDGALELLPGRLSMRIDLPVGLVRSADRDVVIVSAEAAEWIEEYCRHVEADAQARLAQVKEGVARARPVVEAGVARAKPVVQAGVDRAKPVVKAGVDRARPVLELARDHGATLARRSAEALQAAGRKGAAVGEEAASPAEPSEPAPQQVHGPGQTG